MCKSPRRNHGGGAEILDALSRLATRMDALEERLRSLEERDTIKTNIVGESPCCSDDLIGCLDDCVDNVNDLRKRAKDVRTSERRH